MKLKKLSMYKYVVHIPGYGKVYIETHVEDPDCISHMSDWDFVEEMEEAGLISSLDYHGFHSGGLMDVQYFVGQI